MHGMLRLDCFSRARKLFKDDPRWEVHVQLLPQLQTGTLVVGRCTLSKHLVAGLARASVLWRKWCHPQNAGLARMQGLQMCRVHLTTVAMLCRR